MLYSTGGTIGEQACRVKSAERDVFLWSPPARCPDRMMLHSSHFCGELDWQAGKHAHSQSWVHRTIYKSTKEVNEHEADVHESGDGSIGALYNDLGRSDTQFSLSLQVQLHPHPCLRLDLSIVSHKEPDSGAQPATIS